MSFGNLKFFNSFQILQRFVKILIFFCELYLPWIVPNGFIDKISFTKIKFYNKLCEPREFWNNSIYRLNQILNSLIFLKQLFDFCSFEVFQLFAQTKSFLIFGILKLINPFYSLNRIVKFEFFKQAYWAMKFWSFSIHFINWISLREDWGF